MPVWRAFSRLIAGSGRLAALSLALSVAQSVALIPIALLVRRAFDDAIPSNDSSELLLLGGAILVLYLLSLGLGLVGRYAVLNVTKPAVARVRSELVSHVIWLPRSYFDATDAGRLHSLIVQDTERLDTMAKYLLAIVIPSLGTAAILLATLAVIQPLLFVVLVVTIPLLIGVGRLMRGVMKRRVRAWQESSDAFSSLALETLRSTTLIKLRTAEDEVSAANAARAAELGVAGQRIGWVQQAYGLAQVGLGGIAGVVVLVGGGIAVADGTMSLGDLIAFMTILALVRGQLNWVASTLPDLLTGLAAIERIDAVLENEEREPYRAGRSIQTRGAVSWEEVTFGYAREEPPVLHELTLEVEAGESVAILGPTGAGKTTLMMLLLGLYRPWAGAVLVDGEPLDELDVRMLRRQMGVLLQDGSAMRGSVVENIAFGRPQASREEIERVAALAAVDEFAADLPDGYETNIGDDGVRLSAGQRQRIALARALLGGPPLLALDEPTSHLDPATADRVLDNIAGLTPVPTLLLVTHDPLVARRADRVVEVRGGRVQAPAPRPEARGEQAVNDRRTAIWEPSRDELALLRAALWKGEPGFDAWRRWRQRNPEIDDLEKGSYRLLPLVYRNLGPMLAEDPDAGRLKGIYRRSWADNQMVLKAGRAGIEAMRGAGLEVLALKGGALLASAYRDIGARPMSDLDLAVRPEGIEAAVGALEAAGFTARKENPLAVLGVHHSLGFFDVERREIDLHRGMQWRAGLDDEFWREAVPVEVGGATVLTLCPSDQLLHVCVHGAGWNPIQPIRWVADAYKVLDASGPGFDWDRLVSMGTRGRLTLPLGDTLSYLADELDVEIPAGALDELAAVPVSSAERRAHEALAQPPSSRRSIEMLWWFWERHRAQAALDGTRTSPAGLMRYLQGFWGLDRASQVPAHAVGRLVRRRH